MTNKSRGKDLLVVDDEPLIQNIISESLEACGYRVTLASNGLQALETLAENDFDMILMDVRMPEMDGITATRFLRRCEQGKHQEITEHPELAGSLFTRKRGSRTPIVAVTANIHDQQALLQAGVDEFIHKPFTLNSVIDMIEQYCGDKLDDHAPSPKIRTAG